MNPKPITESRWIPVSILLGTGIFLLALAVSAASVLQLRLLHVFQALIYLVVIFLTRRNSAWGFGAGVVIATAWNILNLFVTHLFYAGAGQLWILLHGGKVTRLDTMMVFVGSLGHFLLIVACMAGFLQLRPSKKQWGQFVGGGLLVLAYMVLIVATMAPR